MAQTQVLPVLLPGLQGHKSAEELHEIQECEKLVRLRDQVLSGAHPRIKPAQLTAKPAAEERTSNEFGFAANYSMSPIIPTLNGINGVATSKGKKAQTEAQTKYTAQAVPGLGASSSGLNTASSSRPIMASSNAEFNPVLLEKSVDLKKAEMRLQRQRIERSFQDELDKRRVGAKASLPSAELPVDMDLGDVLSKALTIVQPFTARPTDETAANGSASGDDSFDDNTFYSSQHDTPEFLQAESREPNKSPEDVQMLDESDYEPELDDEPISLVTAIQKTSFNIVNQLQAGAAVQGPSTSTEISAGPSDQQQQQPSPYAYTPSEPNFGFGQIVVPNIPGLHTAPTAPTAQPLEIVSPQDSGAEASNSEEASSLDKRQASNKRHYNEQSAPIMRGHNLSPLAPQPARVSPLAVTRQPAALQMEQNGRRATPPQVAALRKQGSGASSPDSSPQTSRSSDRRKKGNKKNKQAGKKGKGKAVDNAPSPIIKAEPRSPSPMIAAEFIRPAKRQRQGQRSQGGSAYEEARFEQPGRPGPSHTTGYEPAERVEERRFLGEPPRLAEGALLRRENPPARHDAEYYDPQRPTAFQYVRAASPGAMYPAQRVLDDGEARPIRQVSRAVSRAVVERPYYEAQPPPIHYYSNRDDGMSVRAVGDRERSRSPVTYDRPMSVMAPPKAPLRRIIVDEYGREYIEPPRPVTIRRSSVMPGSYLDDTEVVYERPMPARAISRLPDAYEADEYGQPATFADPPYARRVVTQPELAGLDYRAYRERDYDPRATARPAAGEIVQPEAGEPREYIGRAHSVRPGVEPLRYEVAGGYDRRLDNEPLREFARAASVRPLDAPRYEVRQGYEYVAAPARPGAVRPVDAAPYRELPTEWTRTESVRPEQRAYDPRPEPLRDMPPPMAPPAIRAYSVRPPESVASTGVRQEYRRVLQPADGYYDQRPRARADDEVTYVGQVPRQEVYPSGQRGQ